MTQRHETIRFRLDLDHARAEAHRLAVRILNPTGLRTEDGDTLRLSYQCHVTYAGEVVAALESIAELLDDPDVILHASLDELDYGRCLFAEVVTALTRIIEKKEAR